VTRTRSARLLYPVAALILIGVAAALFVQPFATGHIDPGGPRDRVLLIVEDRVSFEQLMSVPLFRSLASGGVGLMTTYTGSRLEWANQREGGPGQANYYAIEWGTTDVRPGGSGPPLSKALETAGVSVCSFFDPASVGIRGGPTNLFALPGDDGPIQECPHDTRSRGRRLVIVDDGATLRADLQGPASPEAAPGELGPGGINAVLDREADLVRRAVLENGIGADIAVVVLTPSPSFQMEQRGDEVTPVIVRIGSADFLLGQVGGMSALTSDTTRQPGLVANVDVAPTILNLFGVSVPDAMTGAPIHHDGRGDVRRLHQLHLDQRRIRLPLQLGEVAFISFLFILTVPALIWLRLGRRLPGWAAATIRFLIVCAVALMIPLMAGGLLPRLTYAVVVPFVVLSTVALAMVAQAARWPGPMGPFAFLGAVGLGFMVVDGLFGWRGLRIPLLGATMFDGARFYGIPNAFLATLLGSSLFVATLLGPWAGTAFLFGAGLFAGSPALGADLGGSATLFLASGLWWAVRTPGRRAQRAFGVFAFLIAGLALVLVANRYLPGAPTHIAGFVERSGNGLSGVWHAFTSRLDVGVGQLRDAPAAWLPMLGLPVVLVAAVVRPEPVRSGLALAGTVWRDALIVLTLAGMASFFANDTGVAAAAPAFLYAATAMAYPVLVWARTR
jgi:hypothetical protein